VIRLRAIYGKRARLGLIGAFVVSLAASGCGGDEEAAAPKPAAPRAGKKAAKKGKGKGGKGKLAVVDKVSEELRHRFGERDFQPDPTGDRNRDPFRSFLLSQGLQEAEEGGSGDITELCPPERSIAVKSSLRGLKLIGIVLRGTKSYALFRDSARFGHIVRRGDCLGKEKAVVNEIGVGYVSLEVTPDAPQGTAAPPAQKRTIALYPEEISISDVTPEGTEGEEPAGTEEPLP